MKVQRRVVVLVMAIVLVLANFSACGNTNAGSNPEDKEQGGSSVSQSAEASGEAQGASQSAEAFEESPASGQSADALGEAQGASQSADAFEESPASGQSAEASGEAQGASQSADAFEESPASGQSAEASGEAQGASQSAEAFEESPASGQHDGSSGLAEDRLLRCDEVFTYGDLQYHVLRVKEEMTGDGERFLLVKMEVFNGGTEDVHFSSLLSVELTDKTGKITYAPSPFAKTDGNLDGTLLKNGKLIGEVAIELGDSTDKNFVMNIAQNFEFKPAYLITDSDIGMTFAEVFESEAPKSEYTAGIPLETEALTVLLKNVSWEESEKEGLSVLLCEMELRNNSSDWLQFMLGMDYDVYSVKGNNLKMAAGRFDFPSEVEGNETVSGIASFYFETGMTDFYMTVSSTAGGQQLVGDMIQNEIITFSLGSSTTVADATDTDTSGSDASESDTSDTSQEAVAEGSKSESGLPDRGYLVPAYPLDLLPIYKEATVVDSMYDYRGGTGQVSKYEVTAELSMPAASYDDAVALYSGYGFKKETFITNEGETEETHFTGSLDKYTVEIQILKFLHEDRDTLGSIVLNY